jgi:transcriptional regulator with XRE-family HTH domain
MTYIQMVRQARKRFALSQGELADLLALSQGEISRLEDDRHVARLETVFALQILFGVEPRDMFPRRYAEAFDAVMRRASKLDQALRDKTDAASLKKKRLLSAIVDRAEPNHLL